VVSGERVHLLAACKSGLESVVVRELRQLGYDPRPTTPGRVVFEGEVGAIARANIWLRSADRVLVRVAAFRALDFGELFDGTHSAPWERWLGADAAFPVKGRSVRSVLSSAPACQKIVKKAIVERLRAGHGVQELPETGAMHAVEVAIDHDEVTVSIDTSGVSLHKRGYRTLAGEAPLSETLAAALVMLSGWRSDRPLLDPFCGSGTIPIEAAMIAQNIAPGRTRGFAADQWPQLDRSIWDAAREEAMDAQRRDARPDILGTDIDAQAIRLAVTHAAQAGVAGCVRLERRAFSDLRCERADGWIVTNPPYGERLGGRDETAELYASMPEVFNRLPTWTIGLITPRERFERLVGREADRRRKLHNATLACVYYLFEPVAAGERRFALDARAAGPERGAQRPEPVARAAVRDGGGGAGGPGGPGELAERDRRQVEAFGNRLTGRVRHFRKWAERGTDCYRLFDQDMPDVPLVVDRYGAWLRVEDVRGARSGRTAAQHAAWIEQMALAASAATGVALERVVVVRRGQRRGGAVAAVREGGVGLEVDVERGLELAKRGVRRMLREASGGVRVAVIGGDARVWEATAAGGGAREVVAASSVRDEALSGGDGFDVVLLEAPAPALEVVRLAWGLVRASGGVLIVVGEGSAPDLEAAATPGGAGREVTARVEAEEFRGSGAVRCWRVVRPGPAT